MEFTIEANKMRQKSGDVRYIDKKSVNLYLTIYKLGQLKDNRRLTFENRERTMIYIENLIKTTEYNLVGFTSELESDGFPERYFITLRK